MTKGLETLAKKGGIEKNRKIVTLRQTCVTTKPSDALPPAIGLIEGLRFSV